MRRRPNILWLMSDQHRADALGSVTPWMSTPRLDRLAGEGTRLASLFAQSPVCVPSRSNFVTGRYPHSHRVRENHARIGPGEPHLFRCAKRAGYRTALLGKNHMFARRDLAPLDIDGSRLAAKPDDPAWAAHLAAIEHDMANTGAWAGARFHDLPEEHSTTHRIGSAALSALDRLATGEDPFLLWVSFSDPHAPHTAPRRFAARYPLQALPLPAGWDGPTGSHELAGKPSRQAVKREALRMAEAGDADARRFVAVYSAMISHVDEWVGRILDRLEALGLADDTIVVYTADHGEFRLDHGLVKKDLLLYDCLLRIPFIIRWPGRIGAGVARQALAEQVDVYPTLAALAGLDMPKGVQGRPFTALLQPGEDRHRDEVHAEICPPGYRNPFRDYRSFRAEWQRAQTTEGHPLRWTAPFNVPGDHLKMIRTDAWKYIWYENGEEELYDLAADPGERHNLAVDPARERQRDALRLRLFEWAVRSEDTLDHADEQALLRDYPWGEGAIASAW